MRHFLLTAAIGVLYGGVGFLFWSLGQSPEAQALPPEPREYLRQECSRQENCDFFLVDAIVSCESGWRMVKNKQSSAFGYFQIIDSTERITPQYEEGDRKFDPYTNIDMGLYLLETYGTSPWLESRGCWHWKESVLRNEVTDGHLGVDFDSAQSE